MMKRATPSILALVLLAGCGEAEDPYRIVGQLASDRIELTAETNEPIVAIRVAEGEDVAAGQVLVEQDSRRAAAQLAQTEAALAQAEARLAELMRGPRSEQIEAARASVEGATHDLEFRGSELDRIREVHERGLASADALDRARADLDTARANLKLRRAQLAELLTGTTIEELAQAEQAVKQAEARRDVARISLERHTLHAPVDGVADARLFEIGERPPPGQPIMVILGGAQVYARVFVPERARASVTVGTAARVHVDGLDTPLSGHVRWVSSEAAFTPYYALTERDRGRLSYVAKVDITDAGERLPDGLPVEVELLVD
jgi:HlyD family secretion protein